jgi:hypothetical protein
VWAARSQSLDLGDGRRVEGSCRGSRANIMGLETTVRVQSVLEGGCNLLCEALLDLQSLGLRV